MVPSVRHTVVFIFDTTSYASLNIYARPQHLGFRVGPAENANCPDRGPRVHKVADNRIRLSQNTPSTHFDE
jgi:hypothetical protein